MPFKKLAMSAVGFTLSAYTLAATPTVVTDIAPLHSLAAQVMKGVAEPTLLIKPEYSPHEYILRPSEARALENADVVFWIGEGLTPWLEKSLDTLTPNAVKVSMLETEGTTLYDFREGATFEAHDHDAHDEHDDHNHDAHDEHDDHDHEAHDEHDDHDHDAHDEHDDHDHEGHDPHAWLDPVNAQVWVQEIADTLAAKDPSNASVYQSNAVNAVSRLEDLIKENQAKANKSNVNKFIVFHDGYQYFEKRFNVLATGAISVSDAADPSPARVAEIRKTITELGVSCVFTEPQFNPNMVKSVFKGTEVVTIGVMDPIGADIKPGENQYYEMINDLMDSVTQCR